MLKSFHFWTKTLAEVGKRIIMAMEAGYGGGYQNHVEDLNWNYFVFDSPDYKAEVFLAKGSGNIVFHSGKQNST